ncbi:beta-lactamase class A [Prauserella muralis]|nr:beta-lactamase class A [Prauserella muralis]
MIMPAGGGRSVSRRSVLSVAAAGSLLAACGGGPASTPSAGSAGASATATTPGRAAEREHERALRQLERRFGARLGVVAEHTGTGRTLRHRPAERFAMCSTFKVLAAAAVLRRSEDERRLLRRRIGISAADLVPYSPVCERYAGSGLTVADLCEAAVSHSDNTAANKLLELVGGPRGVTALAHAAGDTVTRLDRVEPDLNSAVPGDPRDTTTPANIAATYRALVLGDVLAAPGRERLRAWMLATTTSADKMRAGVPESWRVADKTGSGGYGTGNDVGIVWPPSGSPLVIAVLSTRGERDADADPALIAEVTTIAVEALTT